MEGRPFTYQDLVKLALARAEIRGTPGRIVFRPDADGSGGISMFVDDEIIAQHLDPDEIEQATSGRPLN
jgi:hypothetical protein